eukprot:3214216-Amphidinium_carterae.1
MLATLHTTMTSTSYKHPISEVQNVVTYTMMSLAGAGTGFQMVLPACKADQWDEYNVTRVSDEDLPSQPKWL